MAGMEEDRRRGAMPFINDSSLVKMSILVLRVIFEDSFVGFLIRNIDFDRKFSGVFGVVNR